MSIQLTIERSHMCVCTPKAKIVMITPFIDCVRFGQLPPCHLDLQLTDPWSRSLQFQAPSSSLRLFVWFQARIWQAALALHAPSTPVCIFKNVCRSFSWSQVEKPVSVAHHIPSNPWLLCWILGKRRVNISHGQFHVMFPPLKWQLFIVIESAKVNVSSEKFPRLLLDWACIHLSLHDGTNQLHLFDLVFVVLLSRFRSSLSRWWRTCSLPRRRCWSAPRRAALECWVACSELELYHVALA